MLISVLKVLENTEEVDFCVRMTRLQMVGERWLVARLPHPLARTSLVSLTVLPVLPLSRVFPPSVPSSASFSFEVQNLWFSPVGGECFGTLAQEGRGRNLGPC